MDRVENREKERWKGLMQTVDQKKHQEHCGVCVFRRERVEVGRQKGRKREMERERGEGERVEH